MTEASGEAVSFPPSPPPLPPACLGGGLTLGASDQPFPFGSLHAAASEPLDFKRLVVAFELVGASLKRLADVENKRCVLEHQRFEFDRAVREKALKLEAERNAVLKRHAAAGDKIADAADRNAPQREDWTPGPGPDADEPQG